MSGQRPKVARSGLFEADFEQFVLTKAGLRIKLQEQPFQVLEMLVERSGELVTRNEIGLKLWSSDTFVEFDDGLNTAVQKLRSALGDVSDNPRFIETIPRKGYRFIAPVAKSPVFSETPETAAPVPPVPEAPTHVQPVDQPQSRAVGRKRLVFLAVASLCALGVALAVRSRREAPPHPHVVRITQLTRSGALHSNQNLATDGLRLYYIECLSGDRGR